MLGHGDSPAIWQSTASYLDFVIAEILAISPTVLKDKDTNK